jgi:hypothetical protein
MIISPNENTVAFSWIVEGQLLVARLDLLSRWERVCHGGGMGDGHAHAASQ